MNKYKAKNVLLLFTYIAYIDGFFNLNIGKTLNHLKQLEIKIADFPKI